MKKLLALLLCLMLVIPAFAVAEDVEITLWTYPIGNWGDEATVKALTDAFTAETGLIHQGNARSGRMASFSNSTPQTHNYLLGINLTF